MAQDIYRGSEGPHRLLCFPVTRPVALSQVRGILEVRRLDLNPRYDVMLSYLQDQSPDLGDIFQREMLHIGPTILMEQQSAQNRRQSFFDRDNFLFGMYAMTHILFAQARENHAMGDEGAFPLVEYASYQTVLQARFAQSQEQEPRMQRERFVREKEALHPVLGEVLHTIAVGAELQDDREIDFYGGAAFAYQLFQHARPAIQVDTGHFA